MSYVLDLLCCSIGAAHASFEWVAENGLLKNKQLVLSTCAAFYTYQPGVRRVCIGLRLHSGAPKG